MFTFPQDKNVKTLENSSKESFSQPVDKSSAHLFTPFVHSCN